jgi:WD repeat and SOF domain-containing protein 1
VGAGLDTQRRSRYGNANAWSYINIRNHTSNTSPVLKEMTCAEDREHILHMFWVGPITDKVYLTLLSFLFTQDVQLHRPLSETNPCSPQIWIWIHPSSDTAISGRTSYQTKQQLLSKQILSNPWSAPFTHPRLTGIIKFKLWDTEEQVHAIPELRQGWSTLKHSNPQDGRATAMGPSIMDSSHAEEYDHASVVLSDLARFVLCHRFGGIYVDADFVFLRDWGELLRAPWAFAYSWSRLRPVYNTAVLRLRRGSALGAFILTAALANGMDLHPMAITKYLTNVNLEPLLAQLPDALFDPAWLNVSVPMSVVGGVSTCCRLTTCNLIDHLNRSLPSKWFLFLLTCKLIVVNQLQRLLRYSSRGQRSYPGVGL